MAVKHGVLRRVFIEAPSAPMGECVREDVTATAFLKSVTFHTSFPCETTPMAEVVILPEDWLRMKGRVGPALKGDEREA